MDEALIQRTLDALERLMRMFQLERILFLVSAFASFILLLYAGYRLFSTGDVKTADMAIILGATGISTASSSRIAYFLNKAFNLIDFLVRKLSETGGRA